MDTFAIPTYRLIKKTGLIQNSEAHVLMPHEVFSDMACNKPNVFREVLDADDATLREWWASVRNEQWMQDHALFHSIYSGHETKAVPYISRFT